MIKFFSKAIAFIFVFNSFAAGVKAAIPRAKIVIMSGSTRSGKTTVWNILTGQELHRNRHETLQFECNEVELELGSFIKKKPVYVLLYDTPGNYCSNKGFWDVVCEGCSDLTDLVIMVVDATKTDQSGCEETVAKITKLNPSCNFIFVITKTKDGWGNEVSPIQENKTIYFVKNVLIGKTLKSSTEGICFLPSLEKDDVQKFKTEITKMIKNYLTKNYNLLKDSGVGMHMRLSYFQVEAHVYLDKY